MIHDQNDALTMCDAKIVADLSGQRFGRWTVLNDVMHTAKRERKWLCRCECGTERYVLERSLRYGDSLSCGCLRKEMAEKATSHDLTGKTFGELRVVQKLEKGENRRGAWWLCRCSCGAEYEVQGTLLINGRRTHCPGKSHDRNYSFADIAGQRFERLTVLYPSKRFNGVNSVIWHCKCDCGKEIDVAYNNLKYGHQKSCGCQRREHDQKLKTYLTHVDGTSIEMLKSKKIPTDNTTGCKGVYFIRGKYVAKIVFRKKAYYLGTYEYYEDAVQARKEAEEILFDGAVHHYEQWRKYAEANPEWAEKNPYRIGVTQDENRHLRIAFVSIPDVKDT